VYCIDNGILVKNSPAMLDHKSDALENLVAVELKRRGKEFYYYVSGGGREADFVIPSEKTAMQVCYELNPGNMEREVNGLLDAASETGAEKALILTFEQEQELMRNGRRVEIKPAWRWLLEESA
jgi:predicted AAA+ superfamily ATPase